MELSENSWGALKIEWVSGDEFEHLPSKHSDLGMAVRCYDGKYGQLLAVGPTPDTVIVGGLDFGPESRYEYQVADVWVCGHLVYRSVDGRYKRLEMPSIGQA